MKLNRGLSRICCEVVHFLKIYAARAFGARMEGSLTKVAKNYTNLKKLYSLDNSKSNEDLKNNIYQPVKTILK